MARAQVTPLLVDNKSSEQSTHSLQRIDFKKKGEGDFDEAWIQSLIHGNPTVLPIPSIELGFGPVKALCRELPVPSGFVDNLFVTANGNLVVAECKLWRNPEAQRKAIAQILDYAKDLQGLAYEEFETAIALCLKDPRFSLYRFATDERDPLGEAEFIDSFSRNLRLGRFLLLIVGDGIKENLQGMASHLQQHAGAHFRLALVELGVYQIPNDQQWLVVPSILASTVTIERGIVEVRDGRAVVLPVTNSASPSGNPPAGARSLSESEFFEGIERSMPGSALALREFLEECLGRNIQMSWDVGKTLRLRMIVGEKKVLPIVVNSSGTVDTGYTFNQNEVLRGFTESLAQAIPGGEMRETEKSVFVRMKNSEPLTVLSLLLNKDGVMKALERLNVDLRKSVGDE